MSLWVPCLGMLPIQYIKDMLGGTLSVNSPLAARHTLGLQSTGHSLHVSPCAQGWRFIDGAWLVGFGTSSQGVWDLSSGHCMLSQSGDVRGLARDQLPLRPECSVPVIGASGLPCSLATDEGLCCVGACPWEVFREMVGLLDSCVLTSYIRVHEGGFRFSEAYSFLWVSIFGSHQPLGWSLGFGSLRCWLPCVGGGLSQNSGRGVTQWASGSSDCLWQIEASRLLPHEWLCTV